MAKSRTKTDLADAQHNAVEGNVTGGAGLVDFPPKDEPDVFDQQIAANKAAAIVQDVAENMRMPEPETTARPAATAAPGPQPLGNGKSHAGAVGKKEFKPAPDPFGFENMKGEGNRVQLLKSEGEGAWIIRFEKPPNTMESFEGEPYSKTNPHPVIKMLKEEGFRWDFDGGDGQGGWGKRWNGDAYGQDHIDARRVLKQAAEMVGAQVEQGQSR